MDTHTKFSAVYKSVLVTLVSAMLIVFTRTASTAVDTSADDEHAASVYGNIIFTDGSPLSYLQQHPTEEVTPSILPVKVFDLSIDPLSPVTSADYTKKNTVDAHKFIAATYSLKVSKGDISNDGYSVTTDPLSFKDYATYRFDRYQCPKLQPISMNTSGTECDMAECAGLINVSFYLKESAEDPGALSALSALLPVGSKVACSAQASLTDGPQATSSVLVDDVSDLSSNPQTISFLVRASDTPITVTVNCAAPLTTGQSGFVTSDYGLAIFGNKVPLQKLGCGENASIPDLPITVERKAGAITGFFDVSGYQEKAAAIIAWIGNPISITRTISIDSAKLFDASTYPTTDADKWVIDGLAVGDYDVYASALLGSGDAVIRSPHKDSNNHLVTVQPGSTTDLGSTFVFKPIEVQGKVLMFDLSGKTDLSKVTPRLAVSPFDQPSPYILAQGEDRSAEDTTIPSCKTSQQIAGTLGESYSQLKGTYDWQKYQTEFNYTLLLIGLGPLTAYFPMDGSQTCPAPWNITEVGLRINQTIGTSDIIESGSMTLGRDYHITVDQSMQKEPVKVKEIGICLAKETFNISTSAGVGPFYAPWLRLDSTPVKGPPFIGLPLDATPLDRARFDVSTSLTSVDKSVSSVTMPVTVSASLQYSVKPQLMLRSPDGTEISMKVGEVTWPAQGTAECGSSGITCINITDTQGNARVLSVHFYPSGDPCIVGQIKGQLIVTAVGIDVSEISYQIDPSPSAPPPTPICKGTCSPPYTYPISIPLGSLPSGTHQVTFSAKADDPLFCNGVESNDVYPFSIDPPKISCPSSITVYRHIGEPSVASNDLRLDHRLTAQTSGGCGQAPIVTDNRPRTFGDGNTTVEFTAKSGTVSATCDTIVTVEYKESTRIAYIEQQAKNSAVLRIYELNTQTKMKVDTFTDPEAFMDVGLYGGLVGLVLPTERRIIVYDSDTAKKLVDISLKKELRESASPIAIAFRPNHPRQFAVLTKHTTNRYAVRLYDGAVLVAQTSVPLPFPIGAISFPRIAWSVDGGTFAVAYEALESIPTMNAISWQVIRNGFKTPLQTALSLPHLRHAEPQQIVFDASGELVIVAKAGIYKLQGNTISLLPSLLSGNVITLGISGDGRTVAYADVSQAACSIRLIEDINSPQTSPRSWPCQQQTLPTELFLPNQLYYNGYGGRVGEVYPTIINVDRVTIPSQAPRNVIDLSYYLR